MYHPWIARFLYRPKIEEIHRGVPAQIRILQLVVESTEVEVAFNVVSADDLNVALSQFFSAENMPYSHFELQSIFKPLCVEVRRSLGLTITHEWEMIQAFAKAVVAPTAGEVYLICMLDAEYEFIEEAFPAGSSNVALVARMIPRFPGIVCTGYSYIHE